MTFGDRRTPLARKTPMKRGTSALKRTAIPKVGKAARAAKVTLESSRKIVAVRSGGNCEFRVPGVCKGQAHHFHHRKFRRSKDHRPENLAHICFACHDYAHANRVLAYQRGWIVHQVDNPAEIKWRAG